MNFRTTILLLFVLVAAATLFFVTRGKDSADQAGTDKIDKAGKKIVDVALPGNVNKIAVTRPGGERLALERGVGASEWRLVEPVKGAAANDLGLESVADEIKSSRYKRFMQRAQSISQKKLVAKVGKRLEVIVDEGGAREAKGRTKGDSPQIDGAVHIATRRPLRAGDIVTVKIDRSDAYDLWGTAA